MELRYIVVLIQLIRIRVNWIWQAICSIKRNSNACLFSDIQKNTLIIVPHADDEWVGCSQIIRHVKNVSVLYLNFPQVVKDKNATIREKELRQCGEEQNFNLHFCEPGDVSKTLRVIRDNKIEQLFFPSFWDWHPDHIQAVQHVVCALSSDDIKLNLYMYQISCPILSIKNIYYLKVKNKWKMFNKYYKSQRHLPVYRFQLHEILNSVFYNVGFFPIEIYMKINLCKLKKITLKSNPDLSKKICNIRLIRQKSEFYFKNIFR